MRRAKGQNHRAVRSMIGRPERNFSGFSVNSVKFLKELRGHNNRAWFESHRDKYENHLLLPLRCLVMDLGPTMLTVDPLFEIRPAVNRTISRIQRDLRFSRNRTPFRTSVWITFKHSGSNRPDRPAYFFEIGPEYYRYGMGFYAAPAGTMSALRDRINTQPERFRQMVSFLSRQKEMVVEGEIYRRPPSSGKDQDFLNWVQRKNVYVVCKRSIDDRLFSRKILTELKARFLMLKPLYQYFSEL